MENKKLKNKKNRLLTGFTIIELIVVIAIIAILAVIVLVNVTPYINKSRNAAIKGNMDTILTNAAVYFDNNPTKEGADYVSTIDPVPGYTVPAAAAQGANGGTALVSFGSDADQTWCSCSVIYNTGNESGTYCVDSTGYKAVTTTTSCSTRCPSGGPFACNP